jgi:protein-tyrosine phosphatase
MRLLTVCTGNMCRSPLAEHLLRAQLSGWEVSSAGTQAAAGSPMEELSAHELVLLGGDPSSHRARRLTEPVVAGVDLVLTATRDHRRQVLGVSPRHLHRTFTLLELAAIDASDLPLDDPPAALRELSRRRAQVATLDLDLPDPIGQPAELHRTVAEQIAGAVKQVAPILNALA